MASKQRASGPTIPTTPSGCYLSNMVPVHSSNCHMAAKPNRKRPVGRRPRKLTRAQRKANREREARYRAIFESTYGPARQQIMVTGLDMEEAIWTALERSTHSDWKLRAKVVKGPDGEPLVERKSGNWWLVTTEVKLPAPPVDWEWH